MKIFATYNIKGGVGKTATAVNLAYLAARDGYKVLLWDLDPQAAATFLFRIRPRVKGGGKALIQQVVRFADRPEVRHRIAFLPNYDMSMARLLYWGCDVWLNNPLRPLEACGTSGMKSALNGGLNLSIRDGWWDEWYDGENGWEIPTADGVADARLLTVLQHRRRRRTGHQPAAVGHPRHAGQRER